MFSIFDFGFRLALIFALALAWDLAGGEPPSPVHPVVWMGLLVGRLERLALGWRPGPQLAAGALVAVAFPLAAAALAQAVLTSLRGLPWFALIVSVYLLKAAFSFRALLAAGRRVERGLVAGRVEVARRALPALVSRDVRSLAPTLIASAAIESLAENLSDSLVAPLFYFILLGVAGAMAYRAINTLDAMVGYRGEYEFLGKVPARLDDVANWIPARIAAGILVGAGALLGRDGRRAARLARSQQGRTASPNAGWPMATVAGLLGRRLEKPGHYVLGDGFPAPGPRDVGTGLRLVGLAGALWCLLVLVTVGLRDGFAPS
ncbi:MAG: cobalamin biosynthesis protein CobD [Chloroflexi bacterium]|nr:cobalamin biosynthesis protein CobD [Chloroflexota bacterium]